MRPYVLTLLCSCLSAIHGSGVNFNVDGATSASTVATTTIASTTVVKGSLENSTNAQPLHRVLKDLYATLHENIGQNSRKLKLEDFSWGIFSGTKGRLQGLCNYTLVNGNTTVWADARTLNASFEFAVPTLQATWEKSRCMGYGCAMTIKLRDCVFAMRVSVDAGECAIDHLAYLKRYGSAQCQADYPNRSPVSVGLIETTVKLLTQVLNTRPFHKIVKDNVNYAILHLPLFNVTDIRRLCDAYQSAFAHRRSL